MMFIQRNYKTVVDYFRPSRKCFPFNGSLIFLLILLVAIAPQATARPNQDENLPHQLDVSDDFKDVDNLETHHNKAVNGVTQEDHPIIIYKEDFVSEDYVPPINDTKSEKHKRRYKDILHRRRHNRQNFTDVIIEERPEKILFDIIPEKPIIVPEDLEKDKKSHMKLVPLINDLSDVNETGNSESSLKVELQKRPKKYHHRARRNAYGEHIVNKRNPYIRQTPKSAGETPSQIQYVYVKHSVAGKKHNGLDIPVPRPTLSPTRGSNGNIPMSIDGRIGADDDERVPLPSVGRTTPRTSQTPESIFRNPRPENFDFSFMNRQRPAATTTRTPIFTRRPVTTRPEESIFRNPRPENFDFSFMNPQAQQTSFTAERAVATETRTQSSIQTQPPVSDCVWAIVSCCSNSDTKIRYDCFEENGCYGAFWDLNPCADSVRDNFVNFVADYYK